LVKSGRYAEAMKEYDLLVRSPEPTNSKTAKALRTIPLAYMGNHEQALAEIEKCLSDDEDGRADSVYTAARVYAVVSGAQREDAASRERYAARALDLLRRDDAVFTNPGTLARLKREFEFTALRGLEDFQRLTEAATLAQQARRDARNWHFRQAATGLAKVLATEPNYFWGWYQYGSVLAYTGDHQAYRELCRAMLDRFAETADRSGAERIAKTISSMPLEVSGISAQQLMKVADRA